MENGNRRDEIPRDMEAAGSSSATKRRLIDYIPIYIPAVQRRLITGVHRERRLLDFLRANPPREWFLNSRLALRLAPPSSLRREQDRGGTRPRFRVPFVRKINWRAMLVSFKKWIKHPANIALCIWGVFVAAGLLMLFLISTGMLDSFMPSSSRRRKWTEIINQILNALFTIMCLYQHPRLFHHLVLLFRWLPGDIVELRGVYSKDPLPRPHERAHMVIVVALLHITCLAQYVCCGLFWGYPRKSRPDWAMDVVYVVGIGAPVIACVYAACCPLGRRRDESESINLPGQERIAAHPDQADLKMYKRRVVVTSPEWIGGPFDCRDDITVCCLSSLCIFCVFGWNMERLGFGNMYVHIFTFMLLCIAPFWIFSISALNVDDSDIRYMVLASGILLCFCGLLYGGYWRIRMRKRFKLPPNRFCFGYPSATDCFQWLFCWPCSLAQEVRTGNFYDVEDDRFFRLVSEGNGVLVPLPPEGIMGLLPLSHRSLSRPPILNTDPTVSDDESVTNSPAEVPIAIERSSTGRCIHPMRPPLQQVFQ